VAEFLTCDTLRYRLFGDANGYNNGNVMSITNYQDTNRTQSFTYDQLNRIATAYTQGSSPDPNCWGLSYGYDIWANLTTATVTKCTATLLNISVGADNRISTSGYAYDAAGNLTSDPLHSYVYDAENHQTSAAGVTYTYDGDGQRVKKSNGKLYWYGLGGEVLTETDLGGNYPTEYVFFGGRRIARRDPDPSGTVYYYFGDHLGTSRVIVQAGQTAACYEADYYPYGGERVITNTCPQNYKFTGKERDTETQNDYFGARFYENNLGRFMSVDPKAASGRSADPQSWNRFAYSRNNPLAFVDLDGKDFIYGRYNPKTNTEPVTINILLTGPGATEELAASWEKKANAGIGGPRKTSFGLTIDIKVNVTTDPRALPAAGRNEMKVDPTAKKTEVTGGNQGTGKPDEISDPTTQKHETLHFGGLEDKYDPVTGKPLPGEEGSLMGDPRNPSSQFTQEEIDEMGRRACSGDPSCSEKNPPEEDQKTKEKP